MKKLTITLLTATALLAACESKPPFELDSNEVEANENGEFVLTGTLNGYSNLLYVNDSIQTATKDGDHFSLSLVMDRPMNEIVIRQDDHEEVVTINTEAFEEHLIYLEEVAEQERLAQEEQDRIEEEQKLLAEEEYNQKHADYIAWFNNLQSEYSDVIIDYEIVDRVINVMITSEIDYLTPNEREEFLANLGNTIVMNDPNFIADDGKNVYFFNTAGNKIADYTKNLFDNGYSLDVE